MSNYRINSFFQKPNSLFGFFFKHLLSLFLGIVAFILFWQVVIKENIYQNITNYDIKIEKQIKINQSLDRQNKQLTLELNSSNNKKIQLLESQARYKLGMVKKGETYYSYE